MISLGKALECLAYLRAAKPLLRMSALRHKQQKGAALLLTLVFISVIGAALASIAAVEAYRVREHEAAITARELYEISVAARLYVRDEYQANPNLVVATPQNIAPQTLIDNGYLPESFGRGTGLNFRTALNQPVYLIKASWPLSGGANAVPVMFVFARNTPNMARSSANLKHRITQLLQSMGVQIIEQRFNAAGGFATSTCPDGSAVVSRWNTGCLSASDFDSLRLAIPSAQRPANFEVGSVILPSWKVDEPDQRAVLRFAQPDNPQHATMLTDIRMASCTANPLMINTTNSIGARVSVNSGVCDVVSDTTTINNRFNILNVGNMYAQRLIVAPQKTAGNADVDFASIGSEPAYAYDLSVNGNLRLNADLRVYEDIALAQSIPAADRPQFELTHRLNIPNGSLVAERNVYVFSTGTANRGIVQAQNIPTVAPNGPQGRRVIANTLTTQNFIATEATADRAVVTVENRATVSGALHLRNNPTAGEPSSLITENLYANPSGGARVGAVLNTYDTGGPGRVQISGTLDTRTGPVTVNPTTNANRINLGAQYYAGIVGQMDGAGQLNITNASGLQALDSANTRIIVKSSSRNATLGTTRDVSGANPARTINVASPTATRATCRTADSVANGCPNRQYVPPSITP